MKKIFIIAEAGVNHNGELSIAKKLIDAAKDSGVDAVKFQTFKSRQVISRFAPKAEYQKKGTSETESPLEMALRLEFGWRQHLALWNYSNARSLMFLSTPFDLESVDLLVKLGLKVFKIPSGEITNLPYLRKIGSLKRRVLLSTGMTEEAEIRKALNVLTGCGTLKKDITLLHCNSAYPTPYADANLLAIQRLKDIFKLEVGYSDHTAGIEAAIAAVALGATVIEKHFTLDKKMPGPDHAFSLQPSELRAMVKAIRNIEKAMGNFAKKPTPSEKCNLLVCRKSIVAAKDIKINDEFSKTNITVKRPGFGISPMQWDRVLGLKAKRNFKQDELIEL